MNEKELVKEIKRVADEREINFVKRIFTHFNLGTSKFEELWKDWWEKETPPRLEVDMIFVFADSVDIIVPGIEVKYFREKEKFYYGIEQTMAYSLFGFDSIVLWHIFDESMENQVIEGYVKAMAEIIKGFDLPFVYFATKMHEDMKFEFFFPRQFYSSQKLDIVSVLERMKEKCKKARNPLLENDEVRKRKRVLKTILRIPV
ncbi:MAG: hypothetical protein B6D55_07635 [Candidatus Omnitrophica bacterium 4484_70.2]|nr:MAG: hypothetical protein B6D55_07635 [Candidatus Omnitrophica bacterium 4484_70.2]